MMPDQTKPFQIECNTSKYASGVVLTQLDSNRDRHLVVFLSKTFTETEHNYEIYDRELLAIIQALEEWCHYIQGSGHTTVIYSDHQNLTYFRSAQKLNRRQAQWSLYLRIWHEANPSTWVKDDPVWHIIMTARFHPRQGYWQWGYGTLTRKLVSEPTWHHLTG